MTSRCGVTCTRDHTAGDPLHAPSLRITRRRRRLRARPLDDHIRYYVVDSDVDSGSEQAEAADQPVDLVRRYLK